MFDADTILVFGDYGLEPEYVPTRAYCAFCECEHLDAPCDPADCYDLGGEG